MTVLLAFTLEHASRVTEVPQSTIRYWDNTGILHPSLADEEHGGPYGRIYNFRDLVGLKIIAELRDRFGVSLQSLRAVGDRLHVHSSTPWSDLSFYVSGNHLFFRDPETRLMLSTLQPNQIALAEMLDLKRVAGETKRRANRLVRRDDSQVGEVVRNRYVAGNRPVIAGTRIPTDAIWDFYEAGYSEKGILEEYPRLTMEDVIQAIEYERTRRQAKQAS